MAGIVIAQLLVLESEDPDKDVMIYINSSGGLVSDTERDYFMTATAAEAYGLIDEVIVANDTGEPSRAPTALPSPKNRAA